jgi:tyrosyl-tRNA synthetase
LIEEHHKHKSKRVLQKRLAKELTIFVHGIDEYLKAVETTDKLFSQKNASAESLSEEDLKSMEGIVHIDYPKEKLEKGIDAVSFLAETTIFPSKSEARKMIQNGGVSINRTKVAAADQIINDKKLLHKKYLLVQKGKKNYYLINAE